MFLAKSGWDSKGIGISGPPLCPKICRSKMGSESRRDFKIFFYIPNFRPFEDETEDQLSVIMLGFDSLSRSNFIRQMPKSRKLMEKLGFIEMEKHSKVADNTFPNWIAQLMGEHAIDYVSDVLIYMHLELSKCLGD